MNDSMNIELTFNPYRGKIVPKTNEFIEKRTLFTKNQEKLFSIALRELQYAKGSKDEVHLNLRYLLNYLGYSRQDAFHDIRNDLSGMKEKSSMKFLNESMHQYVDISVITEVAIDSDDVMVVFNKRLLKQLTDLSRKYTKYFQDDFCSFRSKFSMKLYERLMELHVYCKKGVNFTTEQLFDIFCLDEGAYIDSNGNFQRGNFEKRTLKVAVAEINNKTRCIRNLNYTRTRKINKTTVYTFTYEYVSPDSVNNGENSTINANTPMQPTMDSVELPSGGYYI